MTSISQEFPNNTDLLFISESFLYNLILNNQNVKYTFSQFMPLYAESVYKKDMQTQEKCIDAVTNQIALTFEQKFQHPIFKTTLKAVTNEIMRKQLPLTPEYVYMQLKILDAHVKSFANFLELFINKTNSLVIEQNMRFTADFQERILEFRYRSLTNIKNLVQDLTVIDNNMQLDDNFNTNRIKHEILHQNKQPRKAKLLNEKQSVQTTMNSNRSAHSAPSSPLNNLYRQTESLIKKVVFDQLFHSLLPIKESESNHQSQSALFNEKQKIHQTQQPTNLDEIRCKCLNENDTNDIDYYSLYNEDSDYPFFNEKIDTRNLNKCIFDLTKYMDKGTFAFHILSNGLTPNQATKFLNRLGIKCYSKSSIFEAQKAISSIINETAQQSISYRKSKIKEGTCVSFDGAWTHVRNSYQHSAVLIDLYSFKIIAAAILFKDYRSLEGNYEIEHAANLMEIRALKLMMNDLLDDRIISFTSDGDVKIKKVIENLCRENKLKIIKDPGHVYLSIARTIKNLSTRNHNIFNPLIENFLRYVKNIVIKIDDPEKRLKVYLNISSHYAGQHDSELCCHSMDASCIQYFDDSNKKSRALFDMFLKKTSGYIKDIIPGFTTQINESFNHHTKKYINKLFAFRSSYPVRTSISILDWNEPLYVFEILKRISSNQALTLTLVNSIYSENTEKIKAKQRRQTQKWKEQHQKEKLKKKLQANSKSKLAHQTQTIIKEASQLSIKLLNDEDYTSETEFSEEESTDNEWSNEEYDETDEISEDSTDDDPDDFLTRCKSFI